MKGTSSIFRLLTSVVFASLLVWPSFIFAQISTDMISIISPGILGGFSEKSTLRIKQNIIDNANELFESDDLFAEKNPILVEFFDYTCGHCKQMEKKITSFKLSHPEIKIVYKEFPIRGKNARFAAKAAIASKHQEQYLAFHQALLGLMDLNPYSVMQQAEQLKLDTAKFRRDMESNETYQIISNNYALAKELKLTGTPSFVIYGVDKHKKPHIYYVQGALNWQELEGFMVGKNV